MRNTSSVKAESFEEKKVKFDRLVCSQNIRFDLVPVFGVRDKGGQFAFD